MLRSINLVFFIVLLISCSNRPKSSNSISISMHEKLNTISQNHDLLGMSAVLIKNGDPFFSHYYGYGKADSSLVIDENTQFRIASISKTFSTLAIIKLWEQGKLDLDKDVSSYLGWELRNPNFPDKPISTRLLISHLSSIRDGEAYGKFVGDMMEKELDIRELFTLNGSYFTSDMFSDSLAPAKYFSYSNSAFGLVATLVEKISGERFDVFTQKNLFSPMGMNASFNVMSSDLPNLATLYRTKDGKWNPQADDYQSSKPEERAYPNYQIGRNGLLYGPQGSLRISTKDLITLSKLFFNDLPKDKQVISKATIDTMLSYKWDYSNENGIENGATWDGFWFSYGMGLHHVSGKKGDQLLGSLPLFGHPGIAYGLLSDFYINRDNKIGLIFITNGSKNAFKEADNSGFYQVEIDVANALNTLLDK